MDARKDFRMKLLKRSTRVVCVFVCGVLGILPSTNGGTITSGLSTLTSAKVLLGDESVIHSDIDSPNPHLPAVQLESASAVTITKGALIPDAPFVPGGYRTTSVHTGAVSYMTRSGNAGQLSGYFTVDVDGMSGAYGLGWKSGTFAEAIFRLDEFSTIVINGNGETIKPHSSGSGFGYSFLRLDGRLIETGEYALAPGEHTISFHPGTEGLQDFTVYGVIDWGINHALGSTPNSPIPSAPIKPPFPDGAASDPAGQIIENNGGEVYLPPGSDNVDIGEGASVADDTTGAYLVGATAELGVNAPIFIGNPADNSESVAVASRTQLTANAAPVLAAEFSDAYLYWSFGANISSVLLPDPVGGVDQFGIRFGLSPGLLTNTGTIDVGTPFDFTQFYPDGVRAFELFGFDSLGFTPDQTSPFVLGITFNEPGAVAIVESVSTRAASVPEPSSFLLMLIGGLALVACCRKRASGRAC